VVYISRGTDESCWFPRTHIYNYIILVLITSAGMRSIHEPKWVSNVSGCRLEDCTDTKSRCSRDSSVDKVTRLLAG